MIWQKEVYAMKKVIDHKMYNTETAQEIASMSSGRDYMDCRHFEETLYRKKTGEFFLLGEGGAFSKYGERSPYENMWGAGSRIVPLTLDEPKKWVMEYCDGDKYESLFGPVEE
jgi:hypothetical protein